MKIQKVLGCLSVVAGIVSVGSVAAAAQCGQVSGSYPTVKGQEASGVIQCTNPLPNIVGRAIAIFDGAGRKWIQARLTTFPPGTTVTIRARGKVRNSVVCTATATHVNRSGLTRCDIGNPDRFDGVADI